MILNKIKKEGDNNLMNKDFSISEILSQQQFKNLSRQINLSTYRRQNLTGLIYGSNNYDLANYQNAKQYQSQITPYQEEYRRWKEQNSKDCTFNETYASALALIDKNKQRQETKRLIKQHNINNALFHFEDKSTLLNKLKVFHQQELTTKIKANEQKIEFSSKGYQKIRQKSQNLFVKKGQSPSQLNSINKKRQLIQLAVQKQLLNKIKQINEKQKQQEQKQKQKEAMKKICYVNLIKSPPIKQQPYFFKDNNLIQPNFNTSIKTIKNTAKNYSSMQYDNNFQQKQQETKPRYKLNIDQILKIPHKKYLIFYSDNYHQLLGLTSPQEMKRLDNYRNQALQKQEALQKLKQKVASYGPEIIQKLPSTSRQKLFRLLYEKQVQLQKYNQN